MSGAIYGGDDVGALVVEVGAFETLAGYAGEDVPSCSFPSTAGFVPALDSDPMDVGEGAPAPKSKGRYVMGTAGVNLPIPNMEMKHPVKDGVIVDWDLYEQELNFAFKSLYTNPAEHPVMVNDEAWSSPAQRQAITELMFEKYQVPAYFLARKPVLSAFANGKPTALVFDMGLSGCSVCPVYEGYLVQKGVTRSKLGGQVLLDLYKEYFAQKNYEIVPKVLIAKRGTKEDPKTRKWNYKLKKLQDITDSFRDYQVYNELRDFNQTVSQVSESPFNETNMQHIPTVPYELSTGVQGNIGSVRFRVPEVLFNPRSYQSKGNRGVFDPADPNYNMGAAELVMACVQKCDADYSTNLLNNVVVTGGTTLIPGFVERLSTDLGAASFASSKLRLISSSGIERRYSSWVGGSILGCLGSFQQMWISKQEYEESGKALVEKKCA